MRSVTGRTRCLQPWRLRLLRIYYRSKVLSQLDHYTASLFRLLTLRGAISSLLYLFTLSRAIAERESPRLLCRLRLPHTSLSSLLASAEEKAT